MARTKFTFEKRQREIARQQKQKDKAARRAEAKQSKEESKRCVTGADPHTADRGDASTNSADNPDREKSTSQ
ncbi:MAG: hypothetical protein FJ122_14545 [Deltaproteobacteria bacterium]|nr:hypothetical protein [Deltaproteobacteria bacterium]